MTVPVPAPQLFPDIEDVLVPWLAGQLAAIYDVTARVCTETPADLVSEVPVVALERVTGADVQAILDRPVVSVDSFQPTREAAGLLASQVHTLLHRYLPGAVTGGAVMGLVNTVKGPSWLSYQDPVVRRYNATYEIYLHPAPA